MLASERAHLASKNGKSQWHVERLFVGFYSRVIFPASATSCWTGRSWRSIAESFVRRQRRGPGDRLRHRAEPAALSRTRPQRSRRSIRIRECTARLSSGSSKPGSRWTSGYSAASNFPFDEGTFDCVVSTFTLCSIEDVNQALGEVYRVLKPGGRFLFLEHGLSPDPSVQKWQRRLNWLERRLADNCRLDRNMRELVGNQPFVSVDIDEFYSGKDASHARLHLPGRGDEVGKSRSTSVRGCRLV